MSEIIQGRCPSQGCPNSFIKQHRKIKKFWPLNLNTVFMSLANDSGFGGAQAMAWSVNVGDMSKGTYYRHAKDIYKKMSRYFCDNNRKAVESVKEFYKRVDLAQPDANGVLDITVTLDGAYGRRGNESTFCFTNVMDPWTNISLDYELTEKCFSCPNHMEQGTRCDNGGKFHGASGSMESHNALVLFRRSVEKHGLR